MSSLSKETLGLIADWAEILTVVLALASAFCGIVLVIANKPLRKIEARDNEALRGTVAESQRLLLVQQERADIAAGKLAGLEKDAADAKARAATAERSLLELQQRLAHRRISKADQDKLVALLSPYPGSVVRLTKLGDSEAGQFADDLIAVFHSAKWSVQLSTIGTLSAPRYGLVCMVDESSSAGKALAKAISSLPDASVTPTKLNGLVANVLVGLKPPA